MRMKIVFEHCIKRDFQVKIKLFFLLIISLFIVKNVFAESENSIEDKIIGSTFKGIAKAYIMVVDLKQFKKDKIALLQRMEEDKFRKRYAKTFAVMSELPKELKIAYGIDENMNKEQAIRKINSLNKKKIYGIIDGIPEELIAKHFKEYLAKRKQTLQNNNIIGQVKDFWDRVIDNNKKTKKNENAKT